MKKKKRIRYIIKRISSHGVRYCGKEKRQAMYVTRTLRNVCATSVAVEKQEV
jgi:ribulose-5-phosphate 4-epimerase/fuculose-1-phosphate aldolase